MGNGHGFVDGNKRTAVILTRLLIVQCGYVLHTRTDEELEDLMVSLAAGEVGFKDLDAWFAERLERFQ